MKIRQGKRRVCGAQEDQGHEAGRHGGEVGIGPRGHRPLLIPEGGEEGGDVVRLEQEEKGDVVLRVARYRGASDARRVPFAQAQSHDRIAGCIAFRLNSFPNFHGSCV